MHDSGENVARPLITGEQTVGRIGSTRCRLAGGFRFCGLTLPCGEGNFVFSFRFVGLKFRLTLFPAFHQRRESRIFLQRIASNPGFGC